MIGPDYLNSFPTSYAEVPSAMRSTVGQLQLLSHIVAPNELESSLSHGSAGMCMFDHVSPASSVQPVRFSRG